MYLTQSVQTYTGAVPLVKDRDGFLRVFVTATQSNLAAPSVRVRFAVSGVLDQGHRSSAPTACSVPLSPNEGSLGASWNMPVPGALIQPNLTILAEVDPANIVAETNETDNALPVVGHAAGAGRAPHFGVRRPLRAGRAERQRPRRATSPTPTWPATSPPPCGCIRWPHTTPMCRAAAHAPTRPPSTANSNAAWTQILNELKAARTSDGSSRYYYGVVKPSYSSGIAGIGYVGLPVAIGWDKSGADQVAAHEWGHNWGRQHAPCGDCRQPGPELSLRQRHHRRLRLRRRRRRASSHPPTSDLMGYCNNEWISDYTYHGVLDYRGAHPDVESAFAQAMQPCLLVWGRIVDGQPVLEPAFQVVTRPSLPAAPGPYTVEGRAADGSPVFRVSFAPDQVADDPPPARSSPSRCRCSPTALSGSWRCTWRSAVAGSRASGRRLVRRRQPRPAWRPPAWAAGRVGLRWDASAHPMLMVRDPVTGQVLSFARGGRSEVVTDRSELDLQLSTGVARPLHAPRGAAPMRLRSGAALLVAAAALRSQRPARGLRPGAAGG